MTTGKSSLRALILGSTVFWSATGLYSTEMAQEHQLHPLTSRHLWDILADVQQDYEARIPEAKDSNTMCSFRSDLFEIEEPEESQLALEMECSRSGLYSIFKFDSDSMKRFGVNTFPKGLAIEGEKAYRLFLAMENRYQSNLEPYFHRDEIKLVDGTSRMNHWLDYSLKDMMPVQNEGGHKRLMRRFECGFENIYVLNQDQNKVYRCYFTSSYEIKSKS